MTEKIDLKLFSHKSVEFLPKAQFHLFAEIRASAGAGTEKVDAGACRAGEAPAAPRRGVAAKAAR